MTSATAPSAVRPPPSHRVPVEHRLLGLDKRSIPFAAVALVVWLLWAVVLPWIDSRVAWTDTIAAGDVVQVAEGVTFTPDPGWGLVSGLRTTDETRSGETSTQTTVLFRDSLVLGVQPGPWSGTATELLDQIRLYPTAGTDPEGLRLTGDPVTITTASGDSGVVQSYVTPRVTGIAAAFTVEGSEGELGILVEFVGPPEQLAQQHDALTAMIESFDLQDAS